MLERMYGMLRKQQSLLDKIEFYIFKFEKKRNEKEENRKEFLSNKRLPQVSIPQEPKTKPDLKRKVESVKSNIKIEKPIEQKTPSFKFEDRQVSKIENEFSNKIFDLPFEEKRDSVQDFHDNYGGSTQDDYDCFFNKGDMGLDEGIRPLFFDFEDK